MGEVNILVENSKNLIKWWEEQAEAHNKLADLAVKNGVTIPCGAGESPPLDTDGSLADPVKNAFCPTGPGGGQDNSCPPGNMKITLLGVETTVDQYKEALYKGYFKAGMTSEKALEKATKEAHEEANKQSFSPGKDKDGNWIPIKVSDTPEFISSQKANVEANNKAAKEMQDLAKAGKLDELKAHEGTPSPKLQEYKQTLIKEVQLGGKDKLDAQKAEQKAKEEANKPHYNPPTIIKGTPSEEKPEPSEKPKAETPKPNDHLYSGNGLSKYVKDEAQKIGGLKGITKLQLSKIETFNPEGVQHGEIKVTALFKNKPEQVELLQKILPPYTKIKTISKKDIFKLEEESIGKGEVHIEHGIGGLVDHPAPYHGESSLPAKFKNTSYTNYLPPIKDNAMTLMHPSPSYSDEAQKKWKNSLTSDEHSILGSWKGSASSIRKSFAGAAIGKELSEDAKNLLSAIKKSPPYQGVLYRGVHGEYAEGLMKDLKKGDLFVDEAPHCTSINPYVGGKFSYGQLMFRIQSRTARPVQAVGGFSGGKWDENEAIGMPGTKYKVVGTYKNVTVAQDPTKNHKKVAMVIDLVEQ